MAVYSNMDMGNVLSARLLRIFEFCNEIFVTGASNVLEIIVLSYSSSLEAQYFTLRTLRLMTLAVGSLAYIFRRSNRIKPSPQDVVLITGCDCGLGFSFAQHLCDLGFTVIASCTKGASKGAEELKKYNPEKIFVIELDVTNDVKVQSTVETVSNYINSHGYRLWAVVNNADTMVFAEFEWQTIALINRQININLLGTFKVTKAFSYLLRKHKARVINITSHCASIALPGVAVYSATIAALQAWNDALRIELGKYGVNVILFVPDFFISCPEIMAQQENYVYEMNYAFSSEQKGFYNDHFEKYYFFLRKNLCPEKPIKIEHEGMYKKFEHALTDVKPNAIYVHGSWFYKLYYTTFKYSPTSVTDYFIGRFMHVPGYNPATKLPELLTSSIVTYR